MPQRLAEALGLLCQAYDVAPGSPLVLNLLAHHCLLRGEHAKVPFALVHYACQHICHIWCITCNSPLIFRATKLSTTLSRKCLLLQAARKPCPGGKTAERKPAMATSTGGGVGEGVAGGGGLGSGAR